MTCRYVLRIKPLLQMYLPTFARWRRHALNETPRLTTFLFVFVFQLPENTSRRSTPTIFNPPASNLSVGARFFFGVSLCDQRSSAGGAFPWGEQTYNARGSMRPRVPAWLSCLKCHKASWAFWYEVPFWPHSMKRRYFLRFVGHRLSNACWCSFSGDRTHEKTRKQALA